MKQSRFNLIGDYENLCWIYNTLTTSIVLLDKEKCTKYFIENNFKNNKKDSLELYEMGFLVDDNFDELLYLEELRKTVINSNKKISDIMIAPTMDCNARCYYCFEKNTHREKMNIETADAVVEYIRNNWNEELFNVTWFGGEPLLATDIIDYISDKLKQFNINFISRITTNGYELNDEVIKKCKNKWNTTQIQVSIDALFEDYDKIKNYNNNHDGSAFKKVIDNITNALKNKIKIRVRINFNPLKKESAQKLMDYLEKKYKNYANFKSYFAPIDEKEMIVPNITDEFKSMKEHPYLSLIKYSQKYGYYLGNDRGENGNFIFDEKGLLVDLKLYPSPTNCYASCPSVFAIDSKGDLYKCHRILGKGTDYCSGNVKTGIVKNEIYDFFCTTKLSFEECKKCKLLPICQGGCKVNTYIYNDYHACTPIKSILPQIIEYYLNTII